MRNKALSLLLAILLTVVTFSGTTARASTHLSGTIQFMTWSAGPQWLPAYKKIAASFMRQHPGTNIQVIVLPYDTWSTKFPLLAATHTEPDVFQQDTSMWKLYDEGIAANLSPYIATDPYFRDSKRFYTHAWASVPSLHGEVTALPIGLSVMVLYYNRNLFVKDHVAMPTDDWTWTDFLKQPRSSPSITTAAMPPIRISIPATSCSGASIPVRWRRIGGFGIPSGAMEEISSTTTSTRPHVP